MVVLALGAPEETIDAVRSLLSQDPGVEIVVVNSGGGGMAARLAAADIDVPVVEREERLFVGAARNLGIRATRAPYVAFLACDCLATPDWARQRLDTHKAGFAAVGSAVVNSHPRNIFAWAGHLSLWPWRLPRVKKRGLPYGASYARDLFERYGYFREDLRTAEDTEFHARLPIDKQPVWQPLVQTIHRNPTTFTGLLRDQFARGARAARANNDLGLGRFACGPPTWWRRSVVSVRMSRKTSKTDRAYVRLARPLIPIAVAAYCVGAWHWQQFHRSASRDNQPSSPGEPARPEAGRSEPPGGRSC